MNDIESAIFQFISHWYDSIETGNVYSKNGNLYQIIQPSEILERYWLKCDEDGCDRCEALYDVDNEQYSADTIIDRIMSYPSFSFSEISEYRDKGFSIKSIVELANVVPVSPLHVETIVLMERQFGAKDIVG